MKQLWSVVALAAALYPVNAQAFTFTEVGDAGASLSTAQGVSGPSLLESISGTLSGFDDPADLFKVFLTGGQSFSATTVGGANFDTRLVLFNADGSGVYFNDDSSGTLQSTLPINSQFTPTQSGFYYLGISGLDYSPLNAAGDRIFPGLADFPDSVPLDSVLTGVYGPTGPGGGSPLSSFDGPILNEGGSYTIALTGTATTSAAVPEPSSTLALVIAGASGMTVRWRNKRKRRKTDQP